MGVTMAGTLDNVSGFVVRMLLIAMWLVTWSSAANICDFSSHYPKQVQFHRLEVQH